MAIPYLGLRTFICIHFLCMARTFSPVRAAPAQTIAPMKTHSGVTKDNFEDKIAKSDEALIVNITYSVKYDIVNNSIDCEDCWPHIYIYIEDSAYNTNDNGCFQDTYWITHHPGFVKLALSTRNKNEVTTCSPCPGNEATKACCQGNILRRLGLPVSWKVAIGYFCSTRKYQRADYFAYNITFEHLNHDVSQCVIATTSVGFCNHGYDYSLIGYNYSSIALPNFIGLTRMEAIKTGILILSVSDRFLTCSPFAKKFLCLSMMPACTEDKRIYMPCRKMCQQYVRTCSRELEIHDLDLGCSYFPNTTDPQICYYEAVSCLDPETPTDGWVMFNKTLIGDGAVYGCYDDYVLLGNSSSECRQDGTWSGGERECKYNARNSYLITTYVLIVMLVLTLLLIVFIVYRFRWEIKFHLIYRACGSLNILKPKRKEFVVHL